MTTLRSVPYSLIFKASRTLVGTVSCCTRPTLNPNIPQSSDGHSLMPHCWTTSDASTRLPLSVHASGACHTAPQSRPRPTLIAHQRHCMCVPRHRCGSSAALAPPPPRVHPTAGQAAARRARQGRASTTQRRLGASAATVGARAATFTGLRRTRPTSAARRRRRAASTGSHCGRWALSRAPSCRRMSALA